jgi:hypothetical protein
VRRETAIPLVLVVGIVAVLAYFVATRAPRPSARDSESAERVRAIAPDAGRIAAAAQGIRVWPRDAAERAALTPSEADKAQLDGSLLAERFDALLARARREPAFAFSLASALSTCSYEDKATEWLDIEVRVGNDARDADAIARFDATYAKCRGLSAEQMAMRIPLTEQAARAGVLAAQLAYGGFASQEIGDDGRMLSADAIDRYRNNAVAFVLAAARSGDSEAQYSAYNMYQFGYWVPVDLVSAYRYAARWARLNPGSQAQDLLDRLSRRMTPEQLRRARTG